MKSPAKPAGRPPLAIDWKTVDALLQAGCNGVQVAARLGISYDTLSRATQREHSADFAAYSQQKKEHGETLLHQKQFDAAMKGNVAMLIWLGKQRLGQKDKAETEITGGEVEIIIGGKRTPGSED